MLNILQIPNAEKFLYMVDQCFGDVMLRLPDGSDCNLKQNRLARQMLRMMQPSRDGISISLSNTADTIKFCGI